MFTQLLEDARSLRIPLVVGYSALLAIWISLFEQFEQPTNPSGGFGALAAIWSGLGDGGRVSMVTFAAALVGQLTMNLAGNHLLAKLFSYGPDWAAFVAEAEERVIQYETFEINIPTQMLRLKGTSSRGQAQRLSIESSRSAFFDSNGVTSVPSSYRSSRLGAEVANRRRRSDDARFRLTLTIVMVPPLLAIALRGTEFWWLAVALIFIPLGDYMLLRKQTVIYMAKTRHRELLAQETKIVAQLGVTRKRLVALRNEEAETTDASQEHPAGEQDRLEERLTTDEAELSSVRSEVEVLEKVKGVAALGDADGAWN